MHLPTSYFTSINQPRDVLNSATIVQTLFAQVFRTDFTAPGFALLRVETSLTSVQLRQFMVSLKHVLSDCYKQQFGQSLTYLSLARFDQRVTTKFHLDGAPEQAFLMLGYEPSELTSAVAMADYSLAAHELGITPKQFLADYNPMFTRGYEELLPYITHLTEFAPEYNNILLINNSSQTYAGEQHQLGVMHQATVPKPTSAHQRVVNSTMLTTFASDANDDMKQEIHDFLHTMEVTKRYGD